MSNAFVACWFRRDLRLHDNTALFHALQSGLPVIPVFIFDKEILDPLPKQDARLTFIYRALESIQQALVPRGKSLIAHYGTPEQVWGQLLETYPIKAVYTAHDYEPYAKDRDGAIKEMLAKKGVEFRTFRDQVLLEKQEVLSKSDKPYSVFTPYSRMWKNNLTEERLKSLPSETLLDQLADFEPKEMPSLEEMGFERVNQDFPTAVADEEIIRHYADRRNFPAVRGTTRLGVHLRFGTISIRQLARTARELSDTYLNELVWREFYAQILWNFPHVVDGPFRPEYANIPWRDVPEELERWKNGQTGYPMVDAGMRELNETGFMHNRVRMLVASFLSKHLLINWQEGEAYFAEKLLDFELASNNGGWQWAAGCGTDAAPYFRIFNPESQMKKFDKELKYTRKWVPEFGGPGYPRPMVEHKFARERCLDAYKRGLGKI